MSFGSSFQECWSVNHGSVKMKSTDNLRSSASDGLVKRKGITERKTHKKIDLRGIKLGDGQHRNTSEKSNKHLITAKKVEETLTPQFNFCPMINLIH